MWFQREDTDGFYTVTKTDDGFYDVKFFKKLPLISLFRLVISTHLYDVESILNFTKANGEYEIFYETFSKLEL